MASEITNLPLVVGRVVHCLRVRDYPIVERFITDRVHIVLLGIINLQGETHITRLQFHASDARVQAKQVRDAPLSGRLL